MTDFKVDASDLKSKELEELEQQLKQFLGTEVEKAGPLLIASVTEEAQIDRPRFKTLLKRFIHSRGLKEDFRVISSGPDQFKIKKRKVRSE